MRTMRGIPIVLLVASIFSYADSSSGARRNVALKAIDACLQRNDVSSRDCKKLNANVQTLVEIYKLGDKSVLPTLFKFTYLTDFYGDALLADSDGFLTAMGQLQEKDRVPIAVGIAGGKFGLKSKERFESIRGLLRNVPEGAATKRIAQACLRELERQDASFIVNYFPPQTFTGLQVRWYSADMYALGERPLWPLSPDQQTTYRLTYLPTFTSPTVITLTTSANVQKGYVSIKSVSEDHGGAKIDETAVVTTDQMARFSSLLDQANFWSTPTELPRRGKDGAEWIMEGIKDGQYRVVVRWCPDIERQSAEEISLGDAGSLLFELAGHKRTGGC